MKANAYKEWPTDKLVAMGKRLAELIPLERERQRKTDTPYWDILALSHAVQTLEALRQEYKNRL